MVLLFCHLGTIHTTSSVLRTVRPRRHTMHVLRVAPSPGGWNTSPPLPILYLSLANKFLGTYLPGLVRIRVIRPLFFLFLFSSSSSSSSALPLRRTLSLFLKHLPNPIRAHKLYVSTLSTRIHPPCVPDQRRYPSQWQSHCFF